jgi:hypothetical protein
MMSRNSFDGTPTEDELECTPHSAGSSIHAARIEKSTPRQSLGSELGRHKKRSLVGTTRATTTPTTPPPTPTTTRMASAAGADFADMPSLASYRSPDTSSHRADCEMSLPSLSSFRLEDLSLASSFHSRGSTNQQSILSEESVEGWGSFTSGNVSKSDTDSEDCAVVETDDENDSAIRSSIQSLEDQLIRLSASSSGGGKTEAKSILRNRGETLSASASGSSQRSSEDRVSILKRPTRASSSTKSLEAMRRDEGTETKPAVVQHHASPARKTVVRNSSEADDDKSSLQLLPARRSPSPTRLVMERNDSLPLTAIKRPARTTGEPTISLSGSSSTCRQSTDGSSSSLRGGDSLPRLPRRTSTMGDMTDEDRGAVPGSKERSSEGDDNEVVDDQASLNSSEGDLSLEMDPDGDESDDCSVQTSEDDLISPVSQQSSPTSGTLGRLGATQTNMSDVEGSSSQSKIAILAIASAAPHGLEQDSASDYRKYETPDETVEQPANGKKRQSSIRSIDCTVGAKKTSNPDGRNAKGEESGTTPNDSINEETGGKDQEEQQETGKPGRLLRQLSSTIQKVGRSASFKGSFRKIGRTASKLRHNSHRDQDQS